MSRLEDTLALQLRAAGIAKHEQAVAWSVTLPIPMPTQNQILRMSPWQRKHMNDAIHRCVWSSITTATGSPIPTVSLEKQRWTPSCGLAYLKMIRPRSSKKSATVSTVSRVQRRNARRSRY